MFDWIDEGEEEEEDCDVYVHFERQRPRSRTSRDDRVHQPPPPPPSPSPSPVSTCEDIGPPPPLEPISDSDGEDFNNDLAIVTVFILLTISTCVNLVN